MDDFLSTERHLEHPIIEASYDGDINKITKILDQDPNTINEKNNSSATALHIAAQSGFTDLVNLLIGRGANVNLLTNDGWTPMHFAAQRGHIEIAHALIKAGININVQGLRYHRTALHYAADQGKTEFAAILLKAGADRTIKDISGKTALDVANKKEHLETAKLLSQ